LLQFTIQHRTEQNRTETLLTCTLVLTIFNEGAYLTFKSIFHKALNLFKLNCEITLESVPRTNQY